MENPQQMMDIPPPNKGIVVFAVIVSVITFLAGMIIGFLARPAIVPDTVVVVTATPSAMESAQAEATPTIKPQGTIMDIVLADARHSQGDINAPVTIVEFSDFK